jgi:membrane protein implicated in regulation of membrane protease activity
LLARLLGAPVFGWRWALLPASAAAVAVGLPIMLLPDWLEISVGVLVIPAVYGLIIWYRGFEGPDRLLFQRASRSGRPGAPPQGPKK